MKYEIEKAATGAEAEKVLNRRAKAGWEFVWMVWVDRGDARVSRHWSSRLFQARFLLPSRFDVSQNFPGLFNIAI
jgi:hypothetical protein